MTYDDRLLKNVIVGLSPTMRRVMKGEPWPPLRTVEALRRRGLMEKKGWDATPLGEAVRGELIRRSK